jgi:hypothetical protein
VIVIDPFTAGPAKAARAVLQAPRKPVTALIYSHSRRDVSAARARCRQRRERRGRHGQGHRVVSEEDQRERDRRHHFMAHTSTPRLPRAETQVDAGLGKAVLAPPRSSPTELIDKPVSAASTAWTLSSR